MGVYSGDNRKFQGCETADYFRFVQALVGTSFPSECRVWRLIKRCLFQGTQVERNKLRLTLVVVYLVLGAPSVIKLLSPLFLTNITIKIVFFFQ